MGQPAYTVHDICCIVNHFSTSMPESSLHLSNRLAQLHQPWAYRCRACTLVCASRERLMTHPLTLCMVSMWGLEVALSVLTAQVTALMGQGLKQERVQVPAQAQHRGLELESAWEDLHRSRVQSEEGCASSVCSVCRASDADLTLTLRKECTSARYRHRDLVFPATWPAQSSQDNFRSGSCDDRCQGLNRVLKC